MERLDEPAKNWKFSTADVAEREHWDDYMSAYEDMIRGTATEEAPWYVVPANKKWFTRLVVAAAVIDALEDMNLQYPKVDDSQRKELDIARALLDAEGKDKGKPPNHRTPRCQPERQRSAPAWQRRDSGVGRQYRGMAGSISSDQASMPPATFDTLS